MLSSRARAALALSCAAIAIAITGAGSTGVARALPASPGGPLFGVTVDDVARVEALARSLAALPRRPTTRLYFNVHEPAAYYAQPAAQIHAVSAVMGELLDSSDEKAISTGAFAARVKSYVQTLAGHVDIWEVGNEVNGNWTGARRTVAAKLAVAFDTVAAAGGQTALTLFANDFGPNNCGDGRSELTPTQFGERFVPARVADGLAYVLLSYYPTQCGGREPSSAEVASHLQALHAIFPNAALGFGEVGLPRPVNSSSVARAEQIMSWAYSLRPALPGYIGGYFWWYGAEDALLPGSLLAEALPGAFEAEAAALG
jgi:hypothetical protein